MIAGSRWIRTEWSNYWAFQDRESSRYVLKTTSGSGTSHAADRHRSLASIWSRSIGIAVEATHFCMAMRGVQKIGAATTTTCMLGSFRSNDKTREEFLRLLG